MRPKKPLSVLLGDAGDLPKLKNLLGLRIGFVQMSGMERKICTK
jgi:hypothetical protein